MKLKLTAREEWFLDALVEQYVYGEDRTEVVREALRLLVGKAQDAGRLPRPLGFPPDNNPLNVPSSQDDTQ